MIARNDKIILSVHYSKACRESLVLRCNLDYWALVLFLLIPLTFLRCRSKVSPSETLSVVFSVWFPSVSTNQTLSSWWTKSYISSERKKKSSGSTRVHELAIVVQTEGQRKIPIPSMWINRLSKSTRYMRLTDFFPCYTHNRSKFGAENNKVNKYICCNLYDNVSLENLKHIE